MKVLYVLRYWPALTETFVAKEVGDLVRRGHEVAVWSLGTRADSSLAEAPGVPVWRAPWWTKLRGHHPRHDALATWQSARRAADADWVAAKAQRWGVDRIHAHFAGEAAECARSVAEALSVPWSVTGHAVDLARPRPSMANLVREARPFAVVCEAWRERVRSRWGGDPWVVPCGVEVDVPQADPGEEGRGRVVCVARDVPKKGLSDLIDACAALSLELAIVGSPADGVLRPPFVGARPPSQVGGWLAKATVFALASRVADDGDDEGLPVAILEAMAAGLPVVATAVAGVPEVVDDEVGWCVPPGNRAALSDALAQAAASPSERARRGAAGRRRILAQGRTIEGQVDALLTAWSRA